VQKRIDATDAERFRSAGRPHRRGAGPKRSDVRPPAPAGRIAGPQRHCNPHDMHMIFFHSVHNILMINLYDEGKRVSEGSDV